MVGSLCLRKTSLLNWFFEKSLTNFISDWLIEKLSFFSCQNRVILIISLHKAYLLRELLSINQMDIFSDIFHSQLSSVIDGLGRRIAKKIYIYIWPCDEQSLENMESYIRTQIHSYKTVEENMKTDTYKCVYPDTEWKTQKGTLEQFGRIQECTHMQTHENSLDRHTCNIN